MQLFVFLADPCINSRGILHSLSALRADQGQKAQGRQGVHLALLCPCLSTTRHSTALGFQQARMC